MARYKEDMNATGVDSAFGRDVLYGQGTGAPFALDTPPFYAFANVPWLAYDPVTTFVVNADSQLLDQYGTPIEGVYAVGEIALRPTLGNVYCQGAATGAGAVSYTQLPPRRPRSSTPFWPRAKARTRRLPRWALARLTS